MPPLLVFGPSFWFLVPPAAGLYKSHKSVFYLGYHGTLYSATTLGPFGRCHPSYAVCFKYLGALTSVWPTY